jgi:hypothetical protein
MLPALAGAVVMAGLWWAEDWAYNTFCPAIAGGDGEPKYQIGVIPGLFWSLENGEMFKYLRTDWIVFIPWLLACAFFAFGPVVAFMFSRGKAAHILSTALLLGVITHGCGNVLSHHAGYLAEFHPPIELGDLAQCAWRGGAWILALSLGGAAVGIVLQMIARAVSRRAARRKAPART